MIHCAWDGGPALHLVPPAVCGGGMQAVSSCAHRSSPCPYPTMPPPLPPGPRCTTHTCSSPRSGGWGSAMGAWMPRPAVVRHRPAASGLDGQHAIRRAVLSDPTAMPPSLCAGTRACCGPSLRSGTRLTPRASRPCGETTACWCAGSGVGVATGQQQPRVGAAGVQPAPPGSACLAPPRLFCR